jgi:hypothetical protein
VLCRQPAIIAPEVRHEPTGELAGPTGSPLPPPGAGHSRTPSPGGLRRGPRQPQREGGRRGCAHTDGSTGPAMTQPGPLVGVRLLTGGWRVGFRVRPDGRTVLEVTDPAGALAGLAAAIRLPFLWIDAGWAGCAYGPGRGRQWWALAIGHVPAGADQPTVTFSRRTRRRRRGRIVLPPVAVDGLWVARDGLWVGAAAGRYTHVRLTAGSGTRTQRLHLVTDLPAPPCPRPAADPCAVTRYGPPTASPSP